MDYRTEIKGQNAPLGRVYIALLWDIFASDDGRTEPTADEIALPLPDQGNLILADAVTVAQKLEWLLAQQPTGWLAAKKAKLAKRFAERAILSGPLSNLGDEPGRTLIEL